MTNSASSINARLGRSSALIFPVAIVLLFGLYPPTGGDLFMHLTVGRWTWQHSWPPMVDVFSYTSSGVPFIAHSWLAGLVFYGIDAAIGVMGFGLLRLALISVALLCAWQTAKHMGASTSAMIMVSPFVLALMWARLEVRPQLFTTMFLAIQLWLIVSVHVGQRSPRWLWLLPPLYALWINVHGGWIQGMAMLMAVGLALVVIDIRGRVTTNRPFPKSWKRFCMVLLACGCALLLNPYGSRLLVFPFEMQAEWIHGPGTEWRSPYLNRNWDASGGGDFIIPLPEGWHVYLSMEPVFYLYLIGVGVTLLAMLRHWRTVDLVPVAIMGLWLGLSVRHLRAVSDAVLLTAPFVAAGLNSRHVAGNPVWPHRLGLGLTIIVALVSLGPTVNQWAWQWSSATQWETHWMRCLAATIDRQQLTGHVMAKQWNAALLYWFHPQLTVDYTWEYVSGPRRWAEVEAAWRHLPAGFLRYVARHPPDLIVITHDIAQRVGRPLVTQGWRLIHIDDSILMFVPQRPDTADLIEREGYWWFRSWDPPPITRGNAARALAETERAIRHCPEASMAAQAFKVNALRVLGRHDEAAAAARHVEALVK